MPDKIQKDQATPDKIHGEGNYKASKDFDDAEKAFVQSGRVEEGARNAAPKSKAEEEAMNRAEADARSRSKGEDPALTKRPGNTDSKP